MGRQDLGGSVNLLLVAGGVGGDLRGLRPGKAALFEVLANLLAARTGGIKILLRVALDLRCAASPGVIS